MNRIQWNTITPATFLVLSNLIIILLALIFHWSILTLLWGYWLQSLSIGLFTILKILKAGQRNIQQKRLSKSIQDSLLFTIHYGIFHYVYLFVLYLFSTTKTAGVFFKPPDYSAVAFIGILFFINHLYSFIKYYIREKNIILITPNQLYIQPYKRIFPMNMTVIAAGVFSALIPAAETPLLFVFLILKTLVDLKSHELLHQTDTRQSFRPST
jgi:hypothetical protein